MGGVGTMKEVDIVFLIAGLIVWLTVAFFMGYNLGLTQ
jgi:hypothetical protein